jgi:hypothetical protein
MSKALTELEILGLKPGVKVKVIEGSNIGQSGPFYGVFLEHGGLVFGSPSVRVLVETEVYPGEEFIIGGSSMKGARIWCSIQPEYKRKLLIELDDRDDSKPIEVAPDFINSLKVGDTIKVVSGCNIGQDRPFYGKITVIQESPLGVASIEVIPETEVFSLSKHGGSGGSAKGTYVWCHDVPEEGIKLVVEPDDRVKIKNHGITPSDLESFERSMGEDF